VLSLQADKQLSVMIVLARNAS